ncbi:peptidyl-prolyl cis-trans isomerase B (cyclophilin B) [Microbacterium sp. SORGH_AS428]|uniref:peptidylprolyl isomerase n=1 Tax=Microbacterium sp. SORGH_AS_0428 TaxID=3041788 RepID=UPI002861DD43|nr:peptidylprolyl isomerase [Microbacterium sp. SORGH_AS_0428]MDR6199961.1 peptidyl-prolyl cis-trans isomerase B (cyclophilin B) [Microbacterium sp. SORGH_AS_0428]
MRARLLALPLAVAALALLAGCASAAPAPALTAQSTAPAAATDTAGTCTYSAGGAAARDVTAPPTEPAVTGTVAVTLQTSAGDIPISMDADRTPCTVNSFVSLATQGYYTDTNCHRLTTSGIFVLQCGDPTATGMGGPGYRYADELDGSETYPAGTVAMANAGPGTNGSQFFLVYEDTRLDPDYTVFGQMDAAGIAVVQQIAAAGTDSGGADGKPKTPVTITGVTVG